MDDDDFSFLDDVAIDEDFFSSFKQDSESGLDLPSLAGQLPVENAGNQDPRPNQSSGLGLDFPPLLGQFPAENAVNQDPGPNQTSEFGLGLPPESLALQGQSKAQVENADPVLTIEVNEWDTKFLESFFQENEDQDTLNESVIKSVESHLQQEEDEDRGQLHKPPQYALNEYIKSLESLLQEDENQPTVQLYHPPQDIKFVTPPQDNLFLRNQAAGCVVKDNHPLLIPVAEQAQAPNSEQSYDQAEDEVPPVPVTVDGVYIWEKAKGVAYTLDELASLGVKGIAGRVSCSSCKEAYDLTLSLSRRKLDEFQAFFSRPDKPWERASPLKCTKCGEISAFANVAEHEEDNHVNWLFLFLAKQLWNCTLLQITNFFDANLIPWANRSFKPEVVLCLYKSFYKLLLK